MERENQIEMIKKYGNKNSCYVPFEGGGAVIPYIRQTLFVSAL